MRSEGIYEVWRENSQIKMLELKRAKRERPGRITLDMIEENIKTRQKNTHLPKHKKNISQTCNKKKAQNQF